MVLINSAFVVAPPDICRMMAMPEGTVMQRAVRVRSLDGVPFSYLTTWLPEGIGRSFTADEIRRVPFLALIERAGHSVKLAQQSISAKLASPEVAGLLQVEQGEPLLAVRRRVFDAAGQVVEHISGLYRPDTYEHHMEFDRNFGASTEVCTARATGDDKIGLGG